MIKDPYQSIRGKYQGKTIAVLGSGPSLPHLFSRKEDVIIGVNGTSKLLCSQDYFLSDDSAAPSKTWFKNLDKSTTVILTSGAAIRVPEFYPDETTRHQLQEDYEKRVQTWLKQAPPPQNSLEEYGRTDNLQYPRKSSDGKYYLLPTHPFLNDFEDNIPPHNPPHIILKYRSINEPISREQIRLNCEGTSAHTALQIAYIMGAKEIHLYGIEFSNLPKNKERHGAGNYFYQPAKGELGMTLDTQLQTMDLTIGEINKQGEAIVYSHILSKKSEKWNTRLTNSFKIEHE
ncbi:UNVERIFIED_CONTAM: hypothetical protein BEN50_22950 [Euhalothece sp. KZN 001]